MRSCANLRVVMYKIGALVVAIASDDTRLCCLRHIRKRIAQGGREMPTTHLSWECLLKMIMMEALISRLGSYAVERELPPF